MSFKLIDGTKIALEIRRKVELKSAILVENGWQPKLLSVVFSTTDSKASSAIEWYVRNQKRVAEKCGIVFEESEIPENISQESFVDFLSKANQDPRVTGVVLQRPFPKHLQTDQVQMAVHPLKDVEGMHPSSIGRVLVSMHVRILLYILKKIQYDDADLVPCTAKAAVACLKSTGLAKGPEQSLKGLTCVVVGHSEIVGKPISFLLMNEGAIVTTCNHMTKDLNIHTRKADAVFVAVGKRNLIQGNMLKPGAALVDVGINPITDSVTGKESIVGDAEMESCLAVAGWITPVPGGT